MKDIVGSIKGKLSEIEEKEDVRVIMAVESGSRAWGFASPDSDYDVRFIYVRNRSDYLRLVPVRDVIEWQLDDVYDIDGWDLKKALLLLHDSNPTLHEWCNSPIVYKENELAEPFRELTKQFFLPKKAIYHYVSMAEHAFRQYLSGDQVRIKKYFYGIRPILAARWVAEKRTAPPMMFEELMDAQLPEALRPAVQDLLKLKKETSELGAGSHIPVLDAFISEQLESLKTIAAQEENRKNDWDALEKFFADALERDRKQ